MFPSDAVPHPLIAETKRAKPLKIADRWRNVSKVMGRDATGSPEMMGFDTCSLFGAQPRPTLSLLPQVLMLESFSTRFNAVVLFL